MRITLRHTVAATALLALGGAAHAQQSLVEVDDEDMMVEVLGMSVDELDDADVLDAEGETIGEIDDVLMTPEGVISAVTLEVGGFLGMGEKKVIVPLDALSRVGDELRTDLTREAIEGMAEFDD